VGEVGTWDSAVSVDLVMYGIAITDSTSTADSSENPQCRPTTSTR
jgi:hypothetical protein